MDGDRWAPYLAVFDSKERTHCNLSSVTGGLGGPSGNVFQLPDMTAGCGVFQGAMKGRFSLSLSIADFFEI